ncbi:MAG: ATP-binding protein [Victivallaceae bacterium]|nr:ATP-binding protein [Victivallaceae bacterium]
MVIERNRYLKQLIDRKWNGQVKIVTGIRRCGKSFLLGYLFRNHLLANGVRDDEIIHMELDKARDIRYRNPLELAGFVRELVDKKRERFYLFVDEIQMSEPVDNPYLPRGRKVTFYDALNELREMPNLDIYVTGSNSRMLSSDVLTEFRGRGDEIRLHPLTFSEFHSAMGEDRNADLEQYFCFGGMPHVLAQPDDGAKTAYLQSLFNEMYLKDIVERKKIEHPDVMNEMLDLLCSSVGSLTNPTKLANTIRSKKGVSISANTLRSYLDYLEDAFLFRECKRYDVRGKAYFDFPIKYYCEDVGLRNARIGFRQVEKTHLMENIVCNELTARGFSVDVGVVGDHAKSERGNNVRIRREIDFVATKGNRRVYIQSAFSMADDEKRLAERRPLSLTGDSFPKIIVRGDGGKPLYDDFGMLHVGLPEFLLDESILP